MWTSIIHYFQKVESFNLAEIDDLESSLEFWGDYPTGLESREECKGVMFLFLESFRNLPYCKKNDMGEWYQ